LSILLATTYTFIFLFIMSKLTFAISTKKLQLFFLLKLLFGGIYAYIHYYHYEGDTWEYFKYGKILFDVFQESPVEFFRLTIMPRPNVIPAKWAEIADVIPYWYQSSGYTMIRIQAILHFFSLGNYPVHVVFWNFFSTLGLAYIYTSIRKLHKDDNSVLLYSIFLIPSFLFWGSGVHKEAVCFFSLGIILHHSLKLIKEPTRLFRWALVLSNAFLLLLIRPYAFLLFLPILLTLAWCRNNSKAVLGKYAVIYAASSIFVIIISTFTSFNVFEKIRRMQEVYYKYYIGASDVSIPRVDADLTSILMAAPTGFYNVVFRPTYWDTQNFLASLAFWETYILLALFLFFFIYGRFVLAEKQILFYGFLFFSITYILLIGITINNLGAIVRYRSVPYLFLLSALWMLYSEKKNSAKTP